MSKQDNDLILQLIHSKFQEVSKKQDLQTKAILSEMNTGFTLANSKMDNTSKIINDLVEQKKIQNGRIKKMEDQTSVWRFIQRKPWFSISAIVVITSGLIYLSSNPTILNLIKIFK